MNLDAFDYALPADQVAQTPAPRREEARLLVVERDGAGLAESTFAHLPEFLRPGDLLVLNDTRVTPARLRARKPTGGRVEILLLERSRNDAAAPSWNCLLSSSKGLAPGSRMSIDDDLEAEILTPPSGGRAVVRFHPAPVDGDPVAAVRRRAVMPLPPYIRRMPLDERDALDRDRYQTVYAAREGAVAAPTAGLHFTPEILDALRAKGVHVASLTLHVGPGTFQPVRSESIEDHVIEPEPCILPEATASAVAACRTAGGRVVAVGTTVTRVLEERASADGLVRGGEGMCGLYIRPGHRFRVVDALITNLHLPRTSLLILVSAFAGRERVLNAYQEAVRRGFRFYSYGDAMLLQ